MMMTPAPLHSFLNTLFLSTPAESSFEDLAKFEEHTNDEDDAFQDSFSCATTIVCQLRDKQISIVQDNALIHGGKPKAPLRRTGSLDMSSSETRWSRDTSSSEDNNKSSLARKPRCPRRRLSMDCSSIVNDTTTSNTSNSIPRRPRRRGTMEFDTAAAAGPSSPTKQKDTPTTTSPSSSPKMPMRRGTVEFTEPPRSRRLSIEETKDENTMRPRFPKRRSSIVVGGGCCDNEEEEDDDEIDVHQVQELEFNDDNNKPSAACDNTRDRMIHCPQRRASIVEMPSAAANALAMKEAQSQLLRTYSAQDIMHNLKSSDLDDLFQLGEDL